MRFFVFIYGKRCGKRFLLSKDKNGRCQILLPKNDFSLEKTMFLELKSIAEEWYVRETEHYKINKKQFFQTEVQEIAHGVYYKLNEGREYVLVFNGQQIRMQFICCRGEWSIYEKYELKSCKIIKQKNNSIFVLRGEKSEYVKGIELLNKDNLWTLENNSRDRVYINEVLVQDRQILNYGDIIYFSGRIFLFFEKYIAIEKAERSLDVCNLEKIKKDLDDNSYVPVYSKESFHRAPRIMEKLERKPIQIKGPPIFDEQERQSIFMDIGAVINMIVPMLGMNLFLIYGMKNNERQVGMYLYSGLFMTIISVICSVSWIVISRQYEEKERSKRNNKKRRTYKRYLDKKNMIIKEQYEKTYKVLQSRYLSVNTYVDNTLLFLYLWNRNPYHEDFLIHTIWM